MSNKIHKLWKIIVPIYLAIFISGIASLGFAADSADPVYAKVDEYVRAQMKTSGIPGLAVGIVKGSEAVFLKGYGKADQSGRAVTPQTPFVLASVSKSITAMAVTQLAEAGKIDLDAPVRQYLPDFTLRDGDAAAKITVRQLLNQTSGFSTQTGILLNTENDKTLDQMVAELRTASLASADGKTFHYSNANFILLANIVEHVSGGSYDEYVTDHIFKPLEMKDSFIDRTPAEKMNIAAGYQPWFGFPVPAPEYDLVPYLNNISSAEDMTHYLTALLNGGVYKDQAVSSAPAIAEMQQPVAKMRDDVYYGMGYEIDSSGTATVIRHPGDAPGYNANIAIMPESGYGIILLENVNWLGMEGETNGIIVGIEEILAGRTPAPKGINPGTMFILFDLIYTVTLLLLGRSFFMLGRWNKRIGNDEKKRLLRRFIPIAMLDVMMPIGILIGLPKFFSANWRIAFMNAPDFSLMMIGIAALLLILGSVKAILVVRRLKLFPR